jgi:transposase
VPRASLPTVRLSANHRRSQAASYSGSPALIASAPPQRVFWKRIEVTERRMLRGMSTSYPSALTDAEWERAQHYFPPEPRRGRPRTHPMRRILDAICSLLRTGCPWRYLPIDFPPWQTVCSHFRQFRLTNTLHALYIRHCIVLSASAPGATLTQVRPPWTARA